MRQASIIRSEQWWDHKLPPIVAAAGLGLEWSGSGGHWQAIGRLGLFLVAAVGVAAFGHVVNDLADIVSDRAAGAPNRMDRVPVIGRAAIPVGCLVVGLLPWVWLPRPTAAMVLLAVEVALLIAYSVPPVRLKRRALAGALADSAYAYVIPVALAAATFGGPAHRPLAWVVAGAASAWAACAGFRGIVTHQVEDVESDRDAGTRTFVVAVGTDTAVGVLGRLVWVELAVAAVTIVALGMGPVGLWPVVFCGCYLTWRSFQLVQLWQDTLVADARRDTQARVRLLGFAVVNDFVERWFPLLYSCRSR